MKLSDKDIKKEIIKYNLIVLPLNIHSIKGSSVNLRTSNKAWRISDGKKAVEGNIICIPPGETVCIHTKESIAISNNLAGTFHSRVSYVSAGLASYPTTLDPEWFGTPLVVITNHNRQASEQIPVGAEFVSLILYYLKTPATTGKTESYSNRPDLTSRFETIEQKEDPLHKSLASLKMAMKDSPEYQDLYKQKKMYRFRMALKHPLIVGTITTIVGIIIGSLI